MSDTTTRRSPSVMRTATKLKRGLFIQPPSPPTTRIPSYEPTPTKVPVTSQPSPTPSLQPVAPPILEVPVQVAPIATPPKFELEEDTNQISAVSCEHSFVDPENLIENVTISDPPLEDINIEYDYEAFIPDDADKAKVLLELDQEMFLYVLYASPWISEGDMNIMGGQLETDDDCDTMLADLIDPRRQSQTTRSILEGDWSKYLGWKNIPADSFKANSTCVKNVNIMDGSTCYIINGRVSAQVPKDVEHTQIAVRQQVMAHIQTGIDNSLFETETVRNLTFVGSTESIKDGKNNDFNRDTVNVTVPDDEGDNANTKGNYADNLLSAFGITTIVGFSAALTAVFIIVGMKYRGRSKQRRFEQIQNDAIELGRGSMTSNGPGTPEVSRLVMTQTSPDGVELVADSSLGLERGPSRVQESSENSSKKALNLGNFMDSLRGRDDDLSYDKSHHEGSSNVSVETEDFGSVNDRAIGRQKLSEPYTPTRFRSELS